MAETAKENNLASKNYLQSLAWLLSASVLIVSFVAWGQSYNWQLDELTAYQLFPLFGLVAFSLMWTHYVMSATRVYMGIDKEVLKKYFEITSWAVLAAILLHPGILIWQLFKDGYGLPPLSYYEFVGPSLRLAVTLGSISFLAFIAYEFHRKYSSRSWWKYVGYANDVAMIFILIHSLKLGSHLQEGWFRGVWYFYGLTLLISLGYIHGQKLAKKD